MAIFGLFGQGKKSAFKFKEAENTACFTCDHVLIGRLPILYMAHDIDGAWQFLCGANDHTEANAKLISLKQATQLDPSINELSDMPENMGAERRSLNDQWQPFRLPDE